MARIKRGVTKRRRHKKILKLAKGYFLGRSKLYKAAHEAVMHALASSATRTSPTADSCI